MTSRFFDIRPINRFAGANAAIRRPKVQGLSRPQATFLVSLGASAAANHFVKEIAYFSYDNQHQFHLDESSLRYYYPPRLPADLNRGFDTFEQLDDTGDEHLDSLLETIIELERKTGLRCQADIFTWRGMMTKVWKEEAGIQFATNRRTSQDIWS
jgi:RAT1-interacting protein